MHARFAVISTLCVHLLFPLHFLHCSPHCDDGQCGRRQVDARRRAHLGSSRRWSRPRSRSRLSHAGVPERTALAFRHCHWHLHASPLEPWSRTLYFPPHLITLSLRSDSHLPRRRSTRARPVARRPFRSTCSGLTRRATRYAPIPSLTILHPFSPFCLSCIPMLPHRRIHSSPSEALRLCFAATSAAHRCTNPRATRRRPPPRPSSGST
jgi:hypothetical protein